MDTERVSPGCILLVLAGFIVLATFSLGCGATPQQNARRVVSSAGIALDVADIASAQIYTLRAHEALSASSSLVEYQTAMQPYDALERALRTLASALRTADAIVTLWERLGGDAPSGWPVALACVAAALFSLRDTMAAAGVDLPPELTSVLDLVAGLVATDACTSTAVEATP